MTKDEEKFEERMRIAERLATVFVMGAESVWVRHQLRKKGAPEWVAYAISLGTYGLATIAQHIRWLKDEKKAVPEVTMADLVEEVEHQMRIRSARSPIGFEGEA